MRVKEPFSSMSKRLYSDPQFVGLEKDAKKEGVRRMAGEELIEIGEGEGPVEEGVGGVGGKLISDSEEEGERKKRGGGEPGKLVGVRGVFKRNSSSSSPRPRNAEAGIDQDSGSDGGSCSGIGRSKNSMNNEIPVPGRCFQMVKVAKKWVINIFSTRNQ